MSRARRAPSVGDRRGGGRGRPVAAGNPSRSSRATVAPPPDEPGKVRCPACRNLTTLTPTLGKLAKHTDLWGDPCRHVWPDRPPLRLDVLPDVALPPAPTWAGGGGWVRTGVCHECGAAVTGERVFCGACLSRRRL